MTTVIAPITNEQVGRAADRFSDKCRKNASELPKDVVQLVLEHEGDELAQEQFEALCVRVQRRSYKIKQEAEWQSSVKLIKRTHGGREVFFFLYDGEAPDLKGVLAAYEKHHLVPADPDLLESMNESDVRLAIDYPHITLVMDGHPIKRWQYCPWMRRPNGRIHFANIDNKGPRFWWFAGVRLTVQVSK